MCYIIYQKSMNDMITIFQISYGDILGISLTYIHGILNCFICFCIYSERDEDKKYFILPSILWPLAFVLLIYYMLDDDR